MIRKGILFILILFGPLLAQDELARLGDIGFSFFAEILDAEIYSSPPEPDVVFIVGVGGFLFMDVSDMSNPQLIGRYDPGDIFKRYYNGCASGNLAIGAARKDGLDFINITNLSAPFLLTNYQYQNYFYEAVEFQQNIAYAAAHGNGVEVIDISNPQAPVHIRTVSGLVNAWDVFIDNGYLYVADGLGGLKIFSLATADDPQLIGSIATTGNNKEVIVHNGYAFVAAGAAGFDIIDVSDPATPQFLSNHNTHFGIVQHLAYDNGTIFSATWEMVEAVDVSDPLHPVLKATEDTEIRAMGVAAGGGKVFVTDWARFKTYLYNDYNEPDIHIKPTVYDFGYRGDQVPIDHEFTVYNLGENDLVVSDIQSNRPELTVTPTNFTVAPGSSQQITATFTPNTQSTVFARLTFFTNDTDESEKFLFVFGGSPRVSPGDSAPDFTLNDLEGNPHSLGDYSGKVLMLVFFASW